MSPRRHFTTVISVALALGAVGAPMAFAGGPSDALTRPAPGEQDPRSAGTTIVRVSDRGGFDWADAGIGAAGGFALSVLGVGLALLVSQHRAERCSYSPAGTRSRSRPSP